jgi:hypothetical protein
MLLTSLQILTFLTIFYKNENWHSKYKTWMKNKIKNKIAEKFQRNSTTKKLVIHYPFNKHILT